MHKDQDQLSPSRALNSTPVFADYARYYDMLYRDKDYTAEADYVTGLIRKYHPLTRSILELGSGTGIHASLLAEKGFKVHGIERSQEMLIRSQKLATKMQAVSSRLAFSNGDIRQIRLSEHFDAVIALFHVMSYQTTNQDVTAAFETARAHLNPGDIFIFDVWYGPAVLTDRPETRIKRIQDEQSEITRLAEPVLSFNENRVDVHYYMFVRDCSTQTVVELREIHAMRYFFKPEIDMISAQTGFQVHHAEEWLSGEAIGCHTWGVCFVIRAL